MNYLLCFPIPSNLLFDLINRIIFNKIITIFESNYHK